MAISFVYFEIYFCTLSFMTTAFKHFVAFQAQTCQSDLWILIFEIFRLVPTDYFSYIYFLNLTKVVSLRMKHPELSILQAFTMVVRAGSAVPMVVINRESDLLDRLPGSQSDIGSHPSSRITPSIDLGCRMSTDGVMNNRSESESETKHIYQFYPRAVDNARLVGAGITPEKESADFSLESKSSGNFQKSHSHNPAIDTIPEEDERGSEDVESAA